MNLAETHQIGPYLLGELAMTHTNATAGTTPDNAEQNGRTIDRLASGRNRYNSAILEIAYSAVINTAETLTLSANGQTDSDSGFATANFDLVATRAYQVASDGAFTALTLTSGALAAVQIATAGTVQGVVVMEFDLHNALQYLRSQITIDASRANTDTWKAAATWTFGGSDKMPAV